MRPSSGSGGSAGGGCLLPNSTLLSCGIGFITMFCVAYWCAENDSRFERGGCKPSYSATGTTERRNSVIVSGMKPSLLCASCRVLCIPLHVASGSHRRHDFMRPKAVLGLVQLDLHSSPLFAISSRLAMDFSAFGRLSERHSHLVLPQQKLYGSLLSCPRPMSRGLGPGAPHTHSVHLRPSPCAATVPMLGPLEPCRGVAPIQAGASNAPPLAASQCTSSIWRVAFPSLLGDMEHPLAVSPCSRSRHSTHATVPLQWRGLLQSSRLCKPG
ncbi:hypothetical protein M011DRAFT_242708 [Sporormia fimetaria CBS 119925]|uniref:Uncharacterized protein n=1 Tax=Sporormia fimetaria CBS 119925 TaxID=1340428 RepID=A0A6A6VIJ2_9PLEO|nr:hypothetical protein M011DRAFT_242708 [Sporormia fimetaria CBS 119925]